jgi:hypothetical protein
VNTVTKLFFFKAPIFGGKVRKNLVGREEKALKRVILWLATG